MATKPENNPFVRWRKAHPQHSVDHDTNVAINRWLRVNDELLDLFEQYDEVIEPWLNGTSSKEPDLVAFIAGYGYTRATTGNWSRLPIDIPDNELDD